MIAAGTPRPRNRFSFVAGAVCGLVLSALISWSMSLHGKTPAAPSLPRMLEPVLPGPAPEPLSPPLSGPRPSDDRIDTGPPPAARDALAAAPLREIAVFRPNRHA